MSRAGPRVCWCCSTGLAWAAEVNSGPWGGAGAPCQSREGRCVGPLFQPAVGHEVMTGGAGAKRRQLGLGSRHLVPRQGPEVCTQRASSPGRLTKHAWRQGRALTLTLALNLIMHAVSQAHLSTRMGCCCVRRGCQAEGAVPGLCRCLPRCYGRGCTRSHCLCQLILLRLCVCVRAHVHVCVGRVA